MSLEKQFNNEVDPLRLELENIPYHDIRKEFDKRSIVDVWRAGTKKKI